MIYYLVTDFIADRLMLVIAIYFLLITLLGKPEYKIHSFIIFASSILAFITLPEVPKGLSDIQYTAWSAKDCGLSVRWDGATGLILVMFSNIDKKAEKQALILVFAVVCHFVIIYDLIINSSWFTNLFYSFYGELIIVIGLLQMAVSWDAFNGTLNRISRFIDRFSSRSVDFTKSFLKQTKSEKKT